MLKEDSQAVTEIIRMCNNTIANAKEFHLERRGTWYSIDRNLAMEIYRNFPNVTTTYCSSCLEEVRKEMKRCKTLYQA